MAGHIEGKTAGLRHNYNVYLSADGKGRYFIYNQRTGTVNVDVKKTWKTGSNQNEEESSVLAITQNGNPIVWLQLNKQKQTRTFGLIDNGYFNSWSSANKDPVLTSGRTNTGIPQENLRSFNTSELYWYGNYPKYDGMGRLYRYGIEEEAILLRKADTTEAYSVTEVNQSEKQGGKVLATVKTEDKDGNTIYHNYTISQSSSVKYADQPDVSDQYSFSVTNAREQMLTLTADKVWQDDGSQAADAKEKRPDISFYLYRTTKYKSADELLSAFDKAIGEQQDLTNIPRETIEAAQNVLIANSDSVEINGNSKFQWNTKQNDWYWISSRFTENERYDENGDPYIYFLVEKIPHSGSGVYNGEYHTRYNNAHIGSQVGSETITTDNANTKRFSAQAVSDAASTEEVYEPNYLDEQYQATLSPGLLIVSDGIHSVTVKTTYVNGVQSNEIVAEGTEGAVQNYNSYWAHTVINYRVDQDKISGRKIWQLPGGEKLDENYLPDVTFRLRRQSGKGTSVAVDASDFRKNRSSDTVENGALYVTLGQNKKTNAAAEKVGFTGTNSYAYTISDLPVYDKYGQKYLYSVKEDNLDNITYFKMGDHPADSAVSFINYYTGDPKATLSFTKEWSVDTPPAGSLFSLDPKKGTITVTTNNKTTVTSLPKSLIFQIQGYFKRDNGEKGEVIASASYTAVVNADYHENEYTLKGTIKCNGGDQTSGNTAPTMNVTKTSPSTGDEKAVWKVELSNLKSLAPDGNPILYEVTETVPDGYEGTSTGATTLENSTTGSQTPVYSGQTFKNDYTGKKTGGEYTSITVQKEWDDMGYDRKPESITLKLYRKNAKEDKNPAQDVVIDDKLTLSEKNSWNVVVGEEVNGKPTLPVYAPDGQPYEYYVTEIQKNSSYQLTGSQTKYGTDGATVTATNYLPRGKIYFKKSWMTQTDGQPEKPLTSRSDFERLLNLGALPKVTFTVEYQDANDVSKWHELILNNKPVSTTFDPGTNPDHYRNNLFTGQNYYTVPLYREGTNSPGNNNENYQQYRIKETIQHVDGRREDLYSGNIIAGNTQTDDTTASITNTVQVVQVEIIKHWEDNDDRDGMRPDMLSTYIQTKTSVGKWKKMEEIAKPASNIAATTVSDKEKQTGNTYTTGIMLLPQNHQELKITEADIVGYTASENDPVAGSGKLSNGTSVATYTFTNTYAPKLFHISAEKQWNDEDDKYSLRNEDGRIDLTLWYRLGTDGEWKKVTTALEEQIRKYTVHGQERIYYSDSQAVHTTTILNADDSLTCIPNTPAVWENLPANAMVNGSTVKVQYKITESGANKAYTGMISSTDGSAFDGIIQFKGTDGETQQFKITNTLQTTSLTIHKEWKQEDQVADGKSYRPDEITFQVEYRAKTEQTWKDLPGGRVTMIKPAGTDSWMKTLTGLPVRDQNGNEYEYRVSEISLTYKKLLRSNTNQVTGSFHTEEDGTETWTGDAGRYLVTVTTKKNADGSFTASAENALIDRYHQFSVEVSKQWEDGDNRFGLRPDHNGAVLKLQYSLDGGTTWADITKAELNWDNCYEDNHGVYTTSEPQQTAIAVSADTKGSPARWEHLPAKVLVGNTSVKVQYRVTEPDHSAAYTDQLYRAAADGSSDVPVNYDDCILWKGKDKEIQKFVIVNTMETVSLSISKNWDGEDAVTDSEALRPCLLYTSGAELG